MNHYPPIPIQTGPRGLSRQELYSYGFKEGQPWAEDRRALESALQAMDKLERDIQMNYMQGHGPPGRSGYTNMSGSMSSSNSRRGGDGGGGGKYYSSGRYPAAMPFDDGRASYGRGHGYPYDAYAVPDPMMGYASPPQQGGWHQPPSNAYDAARSSSNVYGMPLGFQPSYLQQQQQQQQQPYYFSPPPPQASLRSFESYRPSMVEESPSPVRGLREYSESPVRREYSDSPGSVEGAGYYGSSLRGGQSDLGSVRSAEDDMQQGYGSPAERRMQLVSYGRDADRGVRTPSQDGDRDRDEGEESDPEAVRYSTSAASQQWSMGGAPSERVLSDEYSSPAMHSEGSDLSGYTDATRSSGYVESYDVASHASGAASSYGGGYSDIDRPGSAEEIELERDYMSDDVASDEGEYYSSGEEPEYGEGEDVYSDGGYSDEYYSEESD